jgi:hypothetical protein
MKRCLFLGSVVLLIAAVALPLWSSGKAEKDLPEQEEEAVVYVIQNQDGQHEG